MRSGTYTVLRRISHTNIVRFRDLKKSASHFYLVLEFCAGGDLSEFLRERGKVAEETARKFLTQIAAGICMLHRENVLHRDLKPQNILLSSADDDPILKIADFGFARALQPQDMAATVCGSPLYMAPEILRHEPYDAKADLWSVGAILYELLLGRPPFSGANPMQLLANIEKSERVNFDGSQVSPEGQDFLSCLLNRSPASRLSSKQFAAHVYVRLGPLPDPKESMVKSTEGIVYSNDGSSLMVPCELPHGNEWCVPPPSAQDSPSGMSSPLVASPRCTSPHEASPVGSFHLSVECGDVGGQASPTSAGTAVDRPRAATDPAEVGQASHPSREQACTAPATPVVAAEPAATMEEQGNVSPRRQPQRFEEEYVVLTEQGPPISALAKGRHRARGSGTDFCGNLSRIADALEQLAKRRAEQFPSDALALFLRALELLEKALKLSIAEEGTCEPLRMAFQRMLEAAEASALQIQTPGPPAQCGDQALHEPAQPNRVIFEYAVQLAKDAAVALSKGHEVGGWEAFCHEKLTLSLLLLDLLGSEAEGEDLSAISSYTVPIARLVGEIESLDCSAPNCGKGDPEAFSRAADPMSQPVFGC